MTLKNNAAYSDLIEAELNHWQQENKTYRLWESDAALWTNTDEHQWTGWLQCGIEQIDITLIESLATEMKLSGIEDIVLLGMGGSSLCPAMMADTFGKMPNYPCFHVVDSTDPLQIIHVEEKINLKKTFFIVSSKSGNTLETAIFKDYFYSRLQIVLNKKEVGERFIAITDKGTALEKMAKEENFKAVFYGISSIGGRYSALSHFGMVPAGLMGLDIKEFLQHAKTMQTACAKTVLAKDNPAVVLGILLGTCALQGKDKVTLITSPDIHSFGAWAEQLLAESLGKEGKGIIPVDQEPLGEPSCYGDDRVFVYIRLTSSPDLHQDRAVLFLEQAGCVVVKLDVPDKNHLGAELFRWELAAAVTGSLLGINPFNQPDVEESKILTLQLTSQSEKNNEPMTKELIGEPNIAHYLRAHLNQVKKGDYAALTAFIEMSDEHTALLQACRVLIRHHTTAATCLGFGPRFLHSTGQAYKGGQNTGVFLQITADHSEDIKVPSHHTTFGSVINAQAQADLTVLVKRARRVLRIHLGKDVKSGLQRLRDIFAEW